MNVARSFAIGGVLFLILGIFLGMHMGASGDHSLMPVHAHINLLGFTLMTIFGLTYRLVPAMGGNGMARAHFWLHAIGTLTLVCMIFLKYSGRIGDGDSIMIVMPFAEGAIMIGVLAYAWNLFKNY